MSLKDDAIETVAVMAVVGFALWYIERKIAGMASSVGDAVTSGLNYAGQGLYSVGDTLSPIVEPTAGQVPSAVDTIQGSLAPGQVATVGEYDYTSNLMGLGN
jgi:hypothetical protein